MLPASLHTTAVVEQKKKNVETFVFQFTCRASRKMKTFIKKRGNARCQLNGSLDALARMNKNATLLIVKARERERETNFSSGIVVFTILIDKSSRCVIDDLTRLVSLVLHRRKVSDGSVFSLSLVLLSLIKRRKESYHHFS